MRILHIIGTLDPAAGGPTEAVRFLMTYQAPGYAAEVATLDSPDAPFLDEFPFPIAALGPGKTAFAYSSRLVDWIDANYSRFDGVVVHGLWQFCGLGTKLGLKGRRPYMVFPHGMLDPYFKHTFPLKHAKKWIYWLAAEYRVLRDAYRVLFTTEEESRLAEQSFWLHRWTGVVVPFGASRPKIGAVGGTRFVEEFPVLEDRRFVLFLGRIHRKKGCDNLIRAFVKVAAEDPGLDLVMAGPDEQGWTPELMGIVVAAELEQRVHWLGMLNSSQKWQAFQACEAFILPSHQENFGIAVAEALACGRPVLLSDKVNIAPEIEADGAGLMESDTLEGTERLLRRWIQTPQAERQVMGDRAVACFETRYDMAQCALTIDRIFATAPKAG